MSLLSGEDDSYPNCEPSWDQELRCSHQCVSPIWPQDKSCPNPPCFLPFLACWHRRATALISLSFTFPLVAVRICVLLVFAQRCPSTRELGGGRETLRAQVGLSQGKRLRVKVPGPSAG